jgi:hypothetical protein
MGADRAVNTVLEYGADLGGIYNNWMGRISSDRRNLLLRRQTLWSMAKMLGLEVYTELRRAGWLGFRYGFVFYVCIRKINNMC